MPLDEQFHTWTCGAIPYCKARSPLSETRLPSLHASTCTSTHHGRRVRGNLGSSRVRQAVPPVEHVYYEQPLQGVRPHDGHVHQLLRGALRYGKEDTYTHGARRSTSGRLRCLTYRRAAAEDSGGALGHAAFRT